MVNLYKTKQLFIILILDLKLFLDFFVKENAENYLSTWLLKIYQIVNQAKLSSDLDAYFENIVELKINMFQAAFEQYLFTKLFKNNKEVMNCKNNKPKNGKIILEIPDSFPFVSFLLILLIFK